ncbi:DUF5107 domain-containing protein [Flavobacterium nitrogenifigens]|uniref:Tetratricopeptide repeat-containing protein n=1 Tax=Flavobacterium nitrogenifigens TaxID=1617283 RepID=A0A521AQH7_9FLAO|nr:DUF5107 domain-containing protein [Flavobacterium nitrogenifigens]KAF2329331.1 DUF5107 domain-containing protein [Flavobacterium nitrogenifigens]SMO37026.1 Tetratricopeptide repeat-containing protein [Flavobacterium nitrogenifigens]
MKFRPLLSFLLLGSLFVSAQNKPTIKEYKKVFTTYPFSDPDPIPKPDTKFYPYFRFDGFTDKPVQKEWKVIEIENDYIKLMILPEIGGKVWSAIEKSTGKDIVYNNHVVKFRDIAMRGPWTSGGVEGNYGIIGHTPNCATPVDYKIINREDGSISCVIGVLDLLTRTSWKLDINLPKDKAYFTTNSFWSNTTEFEQPYYTWMNTGIKAAENLQFIYPGQTYIGHNGEYNSWPIDKENGKDLSFYKNNNFGGYKSYHVFGKYDDFFGGYYHDEDFGMGRYGNHDDKPGKKIWIWGLSQQGMIWEKLLTDTDGQYVEVQSGRLFNQASEGSNLTPFKQRSFAPYQTDTWTEYWFPVKQTKGFVKANNYGSVNIKNENGWLKIYFSPLQKLNEKIEVFENDKKVYSKDIALNTMQTFKDSIQIKVDSNKLKFVLGGNKLVWNSAPEDGNINRPVEIPKDFDHNSIYGLYQQGKNYISFKDYVLAEEKLNACLKLDANYAPALSALASLQIRKLDYKAAVNSASKALSIDTYDPAGNYFYALANFHLGNNTDAKDGFDIAAASVEFRSPAYTALSKIYLAENDLSKAVEYAEKSLIYNQYNIEGLQVLAVLYRLQNNTEKANSVLKTITKLDPLNHFADFEKYLWNNSNDSKNAFVAAIQNEMPEQTFLELGIWYNNLSRKEEALKVFSIAEPSAEIIYWKAFLENKPVDVSKIKPGTSFPFRNETAEILKSLIKTNDQYQLKYHLGLIEWNRNSISEAKKLFSECGSKPNDPAFYGAKASLFKNDASIVLASLQQAIKLDPQGWRYHKMLAEHYIAQKQFDKALTTAESFYKKHQDNYLIGMLYAKTLLLNKKYREADSFLTKLQILPFEGATAGRQLYHEAKLMQALAEIKNKQYKKALQFIADAKLFPENLGVGKPYDENIDERLENWLDYQCYNSLGNKEMASKSLDKIVAFRPVVDNTVMNFLPANNLVSAWAIEKTSSAQEAEKWIKTQANLYPTNKIVQWTLLSYTKKKSNILSEDEKDGEVRIIEKL